MSVGSVCVLGEPWLELLADRFLLLLLLLLLLLRQRNFSVRPETFLGADTFCLLNKGRSSALSQQSADVFPEIGCKSGKFRVLLFSFLLAPCEIFYSFSPFGKYLGGAHFTSFSVRQCSNMKEL